MVLSLTLGRKGFVFLTPLEASGRQIPGVFVKPAEKESKLPCLVTQYGAKLRPELGEFRRIRYTMGVSLALTQTPQSPPHRPRPALILSPGMGWGDTVTSTYTVYFGTHCSRG